LGAIVGLAAGGGGEVHAASGAVGQGRGDAGFGDEEMGDVAGGGGDVLDLLRGEAKGLRGAGGLEEVGPFDDLDLFGEAAGAEGEFELGGGAFGEADGGGGVFKTGEDGGELVGRAGNGGETGGAFGRGDRGEDAVGGLIAEAEGGVGDAAGRGVFDDDREGALGKEGERGQEQENDTLHEMQSSERAVTGLSISGYFCTNYKQFTH